MLIKGVELDRALAHSRKVPRKVVDWSGTYITEHREGAVWQKCSVVDISVLGVGVKLFGSVPSDLMGHRVAVEVQTPMGAFVSIHMSGDVRSVAPAKSDGSVRVGLEFGGLSPTEKSVVDTLEAMQMVW